MMLWVWFEYKPFCTSSGVWLVEKGKSEYALDKHFEERFLEKRPSPPPKSDGIREVIDQIIDPTDLRDKVKQKCVSNSHKTS